MHPFDLILPSGEIKRVHLLPAKIQLNRIQRTLRRIEQTDLRAPEIKDSAHFIPSELLSSPRDQGDRNTCTSFSTTEALETYYRSKSAQYKDVHFSKECLNDVRNWMAVTTSYHGQDKPFVQPEFYGDYSPLIAKTIATFGVPIEADYHSVGIDCDYHGSSFGKNLNLSQYQSIFLKNLSPAFGKNTPIHPSDEASISRVKSLLARNIPVVIGIHIYPEFKDQSDWRYNRLIDTPNQIVGGHSVLLTGYRIEGSKTIFAFMNSWGTSWGQRGFGTIDSDLLAHAWATDAGNDFLWSIH